MISAKDMDALRAIARSGGDYDAIKRQLAAREWKVVEDDVGLGYLRVAIPNDSNQMQYSLIIGYNDPKRPPYSLLTFSVFPDSKEQIAAFNSTFHSVANAIKQFVGTPTRIGDHQLSFRDWTYSYHRWSLPEGELTLVQEEFDIQDGLDITLWIQPVGTPIEETLHC